MVISMFKIKYRITDMITAQENRPMLEIQNDGGYIDGFFEIIVNDKTYGYSHERPLEEGERGFELISTWLYHLVQMTDLFISGHQYIGLSDIDSYCSWIEFKRISEDSMSISIINTESKVDMPFLMTEVIHGAKYSRWAHEIVLYEDVIQEVINVTKIYLNEVWTKNPRLREATELIDLNKLCVITEMKIKQLSKN